MKKTRIICLLLALVMLLTCLSACGSLQQPVVNSDAPAENTGGDDGEQTNTEATYTMNIGNVAATEHPINIALRSFKEAVEERTNGDLVVNIHDNSVLGGELELLEQANAGTLESAVEMGGANWEAYNGAADIALVPFLFESIESGRKAWNTTAFSRKFEEEVINPYGATMLPSGRAACAT